MGFTTHLFIFIFFPLCWGSFLLIDRLSHTAFLGKFLSRIRARDILLVLFSLGFYAWALFDDMLRLLGYALLVYLAALVLHALARKRSTIQASRRSRPEKVLFVLFVCAVLFVLIRYNYSDFLRSLLRFPAAEGARSLVAPLGLSFITFSALSYLIDVRRGLAVPGSFLDCLLYLTFFPKVISGPIVLYRDFSPQLKTRACTWDRTVSGINRICLGFAKKLILADTFGSCQPSLSNIDPVTAWGIVLLYTLQIYFDFSGYSDIAIGLSQLFGFELKENFRFPYISLSITEFWRRWHISLGTWFREYVYIPLGGSRQGQIRTLLNLGVVFLLTGFWHGAGWNYLLWGGIHGLCMIFERACAKKVFYQKTPKAVKWCLTMLVVSFCWLLFKYQSLSDVAELGKIMLGVRQFDAIPYTWQHYYDLRVIVFIGIGILGSTLFSASRVQIAYRKFAATQAGFLLQELVLLSLFVAALLFMVSSTYHPFIYFRY